MSKHRYARDNEAWSRLKSHSQGGHSIEVYKGYLIQPAFCGDVFYVQKNGFTIASCSSSENARKAIDEVVG